MVIISLAVNTIFKIIIKVTKNNIEKGISKGKQMQGIGQLLWKLREKEGIRQKHYAWVFLLCQNMQELKQISRKLIFF